MEADSWAERSHSIWKMVPLHPQPQPFESMTSYMIRLAEANGLRSIRELVALMGLSQNRPEGLYKSPDYPIRSSYVGSLAQSTGCLEERLQQTTFHPLVQHFGRSMQPPALHRFLAASLAPSLRYCPACLAEGSPPYYSLLWRFLALPGCASHEVRLLEYCGHCGSLLPLLSAQLAKCSTCQEDLRRGWGARLSDDLLSLTHRRTQELSMLLSPLSRSQDQTQMKIIGKQCMARRRQQDLSIIEVMNLSGLDRSVIMYIEQGNGLRASLDDYMRYADVLSCSLLEVFNIDHGHSLLTAQSEEKTLKQIEAAIEQLKRQGEPVTRKNIRNLAGLEAIHLKDSPEVEKLLTKGRQGQGRRRSQTNNQRDEEFVKQVEQAIKVLSGQGLRVTQERICDLVGHTRATLMTYPHTAGLMKQVVASGPPHDLQRLVQAAIEQAQALGTSLSHRSISERIGIPLGTLKVDSQAKVIIQRAQNERRQRQENELLNRVEHAIEELLSRGEKISPYKVAQMVGRNYAALYRRSQIWELVLSLR